MLYGIIGDIHSNLTALNVVLDELDDAGVDDILCVGDIVGYAAHPSECLEIVRDRASAIVAGNHDWAAAGKVDTSCFNADARDSAKWTSNHLSDEQLYYLANLPLLETIDDITLAHSTLYSPEYFDYVQTTYQARMCFQRQETSVAFVGHSHVPVIFVDDDPVEYFLRPQYTIPEDCKALVNVGSVGQPRDMDPRAAYGLYDSETRTLYLKRVKYDVSEVADAIQEAGLPSTNARRLKVGR